MFLLFGYASAQHKKSAHKHNSDDPMHYCILDEIVKKNIANDPSILDRFEEQEYQIKENIKTLKQNPNAFKQRGVLTDTLIGGKRIIPVVFHVIHNGGINNISKAQIEDAIYHINLDYSRTNSDTSETDSLFKSRAADCQIEFRLAQIDPWGNCTDGIDRVYDERTDYAYFNVMMDNSWPYSKYLNVYSVSFIQPEGMDLPDGAIIGGLSPLTPDNQLGGTEGDTLKDGVIIRHDCVGTIGTAEDFGGYGAGINNQNRVFTHESGHFFNLYHPFQDLTSMIAGGDGCGLTVFGAYVSNGDEVDDTPPIATASQGCPARGTNTCDREISGYGDEPDMTQNYMDYSKGACQNLFSNGQLDRINETLNVTRRKLWSYENLIETGVLNTPVLCEPVADFISSTHSICPNDSVIFTDFSYNAEVDDWEWTFEGGTPATSTEANPVVYYNAPGNYDVTLTVLNAAGTDSETKTATVMVSNPNTSEDIPFVEGFENDFNSDNTWRIFNQDNANGWEVTDSASYLGSKSFRLVNFENNGAFSTDDIITPAIDLSQFVGTAKLKFDIAYAGKRATQFNPLTFSTDTNDTYDELYVYISTDCGNTWTSRWHKTGTSLATTDADISETAFMPASDDEWRAEQIFLSYYHNLTNVRFKFQFISNGGNNIYIDNINIDDGTGPSNIDLLNNKYSMQFMPNPLSTSSSLSFNFKTKHNVNINIYDITGRVVSTVFSGDLNSGTHKFDINKNLFNSNGIYFVKFVADGETITTKFIVE